MTFFSGFKLPTPRFLTAALALILSLLGSFLPISAAVSLNQFTPKENLATSGSFDQEFFQIGEDRFLAVANYGKAHISLFSMSFSIDHTVDSSIFKWNGTTFTPFQSLATSAAADWEFFETSEGKFLMVANYDNDTSRQIDSIIYKWNGTTFATHANVPTVGVTDLETFMVDGETFLAAAFYNDDQNNRNLNSPIYKWNGTTFVETQTLPTFGASHWEFFEIGTDKFLGVSNYAASDARGYGAGSQIFKYNAGTKMWENFQLLETVASYDLEFLTIGENHFLASANQTDGSTSNLNSPIFKWNGTSFEVFAQIPTQGASDWQAFRVGENHFLAVANTFAGTTPSAYRTNDYTIDSVVYKWDGAQFASFQSIPTKGGNGWEFFQIADQFYLSASNFFNSDSLLGENLQTNSVVYKASATYTPEINLASSQLTTPAADQALQVGQTILPIVENILAGPTTFLPSGTCAFTLGEQTVPGIFSSGTCTASQNLTLPAGENPVLQVSVTSGGETQTKNFPLSLSQCTSNISNRILQSLQQLICKLSQEITVTSSKTESGSKMQLTAPTVVLSGEVKLQEGSEVQIKGGE